MTLIVVLILLLGCLLIATSHLTRIDKAAVAIFVGTVGWVLYICYGTDFVMSQHRHEYLDFLAGAGHTSSAVKHFIYDEIFLKYVGKAGAIVMFLLATMSIVEMLNNNGCFDFVSEWIRTRNSKRLLWSITLATFIISANLDNLTTTTMMLTIMHNIIQSRRQRMVVGCAIVLAANTGGCFTVIGDPAGVILWGNGAVTASDFSAYLALPAIVAWVVPTYLLSRSLPERLDVEWPAAPYRGDDTNLNRWQRIVMLLVGIGGLWFIPTFHRLTELPPFVGALCVLSLLWIIHELCNRKLLKSEQMASRKRLPLALQYAHIQTILFILGVTMAIGAVQETGALREMAEWCSIHVPNIYVIGIFMGLLSMWLDGIVVMLANVSTFALPAQAGLDGYFQSFATDGSFWPLLSYCTAWGGSLLTIGSMAGYALLRMENVSLTWYLRFVTGKVLVGGLCGLIVFAVMTECL